jgi:hypothetical protein
MFICLCFIFSGCSDENESEDFGKSTAYMGFPIPDSPWSRYKEELLRATTDDEKWALTIAYFQEDGQAEEDVVNGLERTICRDGMAAPFHAPTWFELFPGILKYVNLSERGLWLLAKAHDSMYRPFVEETFQEDDRVIRVYEYAELRDGETSRRWIQLMTGQTFANRAECEAWLTRHKGQFRWNKEQGRFDIYENPATMPSTDKINE